MGRKLRWFFLLVLFAGTAGCFTTAPVKRGTKLAYDEAYAAREDLTALVADRLQRRAPEEAFYAAEIDKSRALAGLSTVDTTAGDGQVEPQEPPAPVRVADGTRGGTRALVLGEMPQAVTQEQTQRLDRAFWEEQRITEQRVDMVNRRLLPIELALRGRYVISTVEEVQRSLRPDQAVVSYYLLGDAVQVFVVDAAGFRSERLAATTSELRLMVMALRQALSQQAPWQEPARALYTSLLAPLAPELSRAKSLTVVPHGFIANVPFSVLLDEQGQTTASRMTVSYLPAASYLRYVLNRPLPVAPPRMLAVGGGNFPEPWQPLPFARQEARALARVFGQSLHLDGREATPERVVEVVPTYNVLHFATHGLLAGQLRGRASSLVLAESPASEGYLPASTISKLDLSHTYLAVLSACQTSVEHGGDLGSLSAAFLAGGAPSVVGSLWQVADDSTALVMMEFYTHFLELGPGQALRQAQLALAQDSRFAHPYHWGAFVLYGSEQ